MFEEIITTIRTQIINKMRERVANDKVYVFRETDDYGEEKIYCDLSVGYPDEIGYYPDVVQVYGGNGKVVVTVRDAECNDRDILADDTELSTDDLAAILDAMIEDKAVV